MMDNVERPWNVLGPVAAVSQCHDPEQGHCGSSGTSPAPATQPFPLFLGQRLGGDVLHRGTLWLREGRAGAPWEERLDLAASRKRQRRI